MKKLILLLLTLMINISLPVFSEELPVPNDDMSVDANRNPVHYKYINDYANRLKDAFEKNSYNRNHMGTSYNYVLKRDGTICDLKRELYDSKKLTETVKNIILTTSPSPFSEGMNSEEFNIHVFMGVENYEEFSVKFFPQKNLISIYNIKKR